jgi:hypothetical protein
MAKRSNGWSTSLTNSIASDRHDGLRIGAELGGPIRRLSRLLHSAGAMHKPRQLPASRETPASVGACHFHSNL